MATTLITQIDHDGAAHGPPLRTSLDSRRRVGQSTFGFAAARVSPPVQLDDLDRVHGWPRCEVVLDDEDVPAILKVSCAYVGGKDYLVL
ncbi:MAG: hypothetical protein QOD31_1483 [Pseudonocardiales bacterium]|jgi:hypothetical protein|nr:hypothetical protein [Pseudonocardiales bacterium]